MAQFRIPNSDEVFSDAEHAAEALRQFLGWDKIFLSATFRVDAETDAVSVYESGGECASHEVDRERDSHAAGDPSAPRISWTK